MNPVTRLIWIRMGISAAWLLHTVSHAQLNANPYLFEERDSGQPALRLGRLLSDKQMDDNAYVTGTMWMTPEEKKRQTVIFAQLLSLIDRLQRQGEMKKEEKTGLTKVLNALQPTGRVLLGGIDPKWLEVNLRRDPVLLPGDRLEIPWRPDVVRVMLSLGQVCEIPFTPGATALRYVNACTGTSGAWAWVIQADGRVQKTGLRDWNRYDSSLPSPGAWLWVPEQESALPDSFHLAWTQWLANQGVSNRLPLESFSDYRRLPALAQENTDKQNTMYSPPYGQYSSSNWGYVGLLQTPTARMQKSGNAGVSMGVAYPQTHVNLFFQPLSWAEMGVRYTDVSNRSYGIESFSGNQSYKDKSIDLKLKLLNESDRMPELAVGWRDIGGTGLFSSEYLVGNKRLGQVDYSLGLAWGNLGGRADIRNPLSNIFGRRFDSRAYSGGDYGGQFSTGTWFHGPVALFGGLSYQSPLNTEFKLEWDSNNYRNEPQNNNFNAKTPLNVGVSYHWKRGIDLNAGLVRGDTVMFGFSMFTDLSGMYMPKPFDPPVSVFAKPQSETKLNWNNIAGEIETHTQWNVRQILQDEESKKISLHINNAKTIYPQNRLYKAVAVLNRDAPADVQTFDFQFITNGDLLATQTVDRADWVKSQTEPARTQDGFKLPTVNYEIQSAASEKPLSERKSALLKLEPGLDFSYVLQGPDAFVIYRFDAALNASAELPWGIEMNGKTRLAMFGNYGDFRNTGSSDLPRVRTYMREYFVASNVTLANLSLKKSSRLSRDVFASVYGGFMEEMFAGAGSEVLYRQPGSPWALGLDVNHVQQRDFAQDFHLRDYQVNTGHLTSYWQTPFENIHSSLSLGQYLAGDRGATLTLSKVFHNGASMGVFATKTNVSAANFGEGSFDKGIFLTVPFDAFMPKSSLLRAAFNWRPLTRDGGAKLNRPVSLINETSWLDPMVYSNNSMARPPNDLSAPDDHLEPWQRLDP